MAKAGKSDKANADGIVNICRNRRATYEYEISDTIECGLVLVGTEVKSLRAGHAILDDAYARIVKDELWLMGCEIPEYTFGNRLNHVPKRMRKLLLRRREIERFAEKAFKGGLAKIEIGVARGKQDHDKRHSLKSAEAKREIDRGMSRRDR